METSVSYEVRDMTGTLFRNEKKEEGDNRPNATGTGMIGNRKIRISAWTKEGKSGKFQSLKFEWADERPQPNRSPEVAAPPSRLGGAADFGDDVPFEMGWR
jgi:hypothetical protein